MKLSNYYRVTNCRRDTFKDESTSSFTIDQKKDSTASRLVTQSHMKVRKKLTHASSIINKSCNHNLIEWRFRLNGKTERIKSQDKE